MTKLISNTPAAAKDDPFKAVGGALVRDIWYVAMTAGELKSGKLYKKMYLGEPIVVAVNKVDVEGANPDKVLQQLTEYGLVAEEYGGDVLFQRVSALKGEGINELLDAVLLTADAGLDLRANPARQARGERPGRPPSASNPCCPAAAVSVPPPP